MDALIEGLRLVTAWPACGLMFLGILLGLYFGAVPGLGGMIGFSLLLPFTFGMDPVGAFALLLGMYAVTTTSDTLSAVLLGVPGTAAAAATVVDGYPLAKRGEAMRALGASYTSSALGGVIGAAVGAASLPILKPIVLSFAPPEFFMLGVLGLTFVGALSGRSRSERCARRVFRAAAGDHRLFHAGRHCPLQLRDQLSPQRARNRPGRARTFLGSGNQSNWRPRACRSPMPASRTQGANPARRTRRVHRIGG